MDEEEVLSDPPVTPNYIPTGRAMREFASEYRLHNEVEAWGAGPVADVDALVKKSGPVAKSFVRRAKKNPEDALYDPVLLAIERGELIVVVLNANDSWSEIDVAIEFWGTTVGGAESIVSGRLMRVDQLPTPLPANLPEESPVCFRRGEWNKWRREHAERSGWATPKMEKNAREFGPAERVTQQEFDEWYLERFRTWPEGKSRPTRDVDDPKAAREAFKGRASGLRKLIREARKNVAPEWTLPGRNGRKAAEAEAARQKKALEQN